jgi:hypothetical protein
MANQNASLTVSVSFPLGSENPSLEFLTKCPFTGGQAGYIDIPGATLSAVEFDVPFGSVASPTLVYVKNLSGHDLGVRLNSANANEYQVPTNGQLLLAGFPATAAAVPLTAVKLFTTTAQVTDGQVFFAVFGDPV